MSSIFEYIGTHTMSILIFHLLAFKLVNIFYFYIMKDSEVIYQISNDSGLPWNVIYIWNCFPAFHRIFCRKNLFGNKKKC